jgi:predicted RNA-binding Zn-ribbon protein involved in translation (DUF1610 family)
MTYIEIFAYLPKTDCGECASSTCLAFAKRVAMRSAEITVCPYVALECPSCGWTQKEPFRVCPACKLSVRNTRSQEDSLATQCPKCGYEQAEPFAECPNCGVSVVASVRNARRMGKTGVYEAPVSEEEKAKATLKQKGETPTYQCPFCGFVTQKVLPECPNCGYSGGEGFSGKA